MQTTVGRGSRPGHSRMAGLHLPLLAASAVGVGVVLWLWHEQRQRSAALLAAAALQMRQRVAMESAEAQVLRTALCAFYAAHAPDGIANVEDLVARVVGGPPTSVGGVSVGGVLWSVEELGEKLVSSARLQTRP